MSLVVEVPPTELVVDFETPTKLYDAICSCDWDVALQAVAEHPEQAKTWVVRHYEDEDDDGNQEVMWRFLPIHSACARQPPASLIEALLKAFPDGASCEDDQGMYSLHYACGNQASQDIVRLLLEHYPEATKSTDPRGMLPIHYLACWGPSSVSLIDMVLLENRDIGDVRDEDGNTALDLALDGEYPERDDVVDALRRWLGESQKSSTKPLSLNTNDPAESVLKENTEVNSPMSNRSVDVDAKPALDASYAESTPGRSLSDKQALISIQARHEELKEGYDRLVMELESTKAQLLDKNMQLGSAQEELTQKDVEHELKLAELLEGNENLKIQLAEKEAEFDSKVSAKEDEFNSKLAAKEESAMAELVEAKAELTTKLAEQENAFKAKLSDQEVEFKLSVVEKETALLAAKHELETLLLELEQDLSSKVAEKDAALAKAEEESKVIVSEKAVEFESKLAEKEAEVSKMSETLASSESALSATKEALQESKEECEALQTTLADTTKQRDLSMRKIDDINQRLGSLSVSMTSMWEQQEMVIEKAQARSVTLKQSTEMRREKLKAFLDFEDDFASGILVECEDETKALDKQTKEMNAIMAVIDAMRT